ncbi:hypothetical protein ACWCXB_34235 [Streptomyces sp. NPDC001514]
MKAQVRAVLRARIALAAADGGSNGPLVSVRPLQFKITHDEVVTALQVEHATVMAPGQWAAFHLPTSHGGALTTYYGESGRLTCIAVDALHGPQVTWEGLRLVGDVPSKLADRFADHMQAQGLRERIRCSQYGDLGADEIGLVLRAQRAGDILLTRPVFVAREWADRVCDAWEGSIPMEEWHTYC